MRVWAEAPAQLRQRSCISWWYPKICELVDTPPTRIVKTDVELISLLDGEMPEGFQDFMEELRAAVRVLGGYPVFLRTGHTSGKFEWDRTCCVRRSGGLGVHVYRLVETCLVADILGLPYDVWAARELLGGYNAFSLPGGLPVGIERRVFVDAGKVVCVHPYWETESFEPFEDHLPDTWRATLYGLNHSAVDLDEIRHGSLRIGYALGGRWSIDWMLTKEGWCMIDMGAAALSYHTPTCPHSDYAEGDLEMEGE